MLLKKNEKVRNRAILGAYSTFSWLEQHGETYAIMGIDKEFGEIVAGPQSVHYHTIHHGDESACLGFK